MRELVKTLPDPPGPGSDIISLTARSPPPSRSVFLEHGRPCRVLGRTAVSALPDCFRKSLQLPWIDWYNSLTKPTWTPAPGTIGLIWQILYPVILISFGFVFVQAIRGKVSWMIALPFAINLVANLIFTPIQFGMRNLPLAAVDILIIWATIIWCIAAIWSHYKWVSIAQVPYFIWVSIASVLQLSITWSNWGK